MSQFLAGLDTIENDPKMVEMKLVWACQRDSQIPEAPICRLSQMQFSADTSRQRFYSLIRKGPVVDSSRKIAWSFDRNKLISLNWCTAQQFLRGRSYDEFS